MSSLTSTLRHRWPAILIAALVVGWVFWLRAPSWPAKIWNVDESIHAAVADIILDGGVIYRDAIDQRTPLSYYVFAAVFSVTGNNLSAIRVVIAAMIGLTALLLGATVRRRHDGLTAILAMVAYGAMSSQLLYPADTFAANTEWFVGIFTAAAAACFWLGRDPLPSARRSFWAGGLMACAVLSKQSALLEVAAPLLALLGALTVGGMTFRQTLLRATALLGGFLGPILLTITALAAAGGWDDFWFYAWNYNVQIYGPEIAFPGKIASAGPWILAIWMQYPVLCITGAATGLALIWRAFQAWPTGTMRESRPVEFYLLAWCAMSLGSAMSGGRGFDHYFIVCLAPFSWAAACGATVGGRRLLQCIGPRASHPAIVWALCLMVFAVPAFWQARLARAVVIQPDDPSYRILDVVTQHSGPDDPIFVWGFNADVYTLAHRKAASRFIYCSFQTGLIPWTNTAPEIDTTYAVVPHAMDDLLTDLNRTQPRVIVDASWLTYRGFAKYPLKDFPRLNDWIDQHYVEFDPVRLRKLGFAVHLRRDDITSLPEPIAEKPSERVRLEVPELVSPGVVEVGVVGESDNGPVTGLALTRGGELVAAVTIGEYPRAHILIPIVVDQTEATVPLQCWIRHGHGNWEPGPTRTAKVAMISVTAEQATNFALPLVTAKLPSVGVRALLEPRVDRNEDHRSYALHAPSLLRYELPVGINRVSGSYSIPPGAYAPENQHPTDGAIFILTMRLADGTTQELYRRAIEPAHYPEHRGPQPFYLELPAAEGPRVLEFEISPGPAGDASSDWTQWNDIRLETSP